MARYHRNRAPHRKLNTPDRGADVKAFQQGLNKRAAQRGWKTRVTADGEYGRATHELFRDVAYAIGLPKDLPPTIAAQRAVRWPSTRSRKARKRAQERRRKRPTKGQLTEHFHIEEFACKDGTPAPAYMEGPLREWCKRVGEPMRAKYGPCAIHSAYRHDAYNRAIGGEDNSYHVYEVRKSQPAVDSHFAKGPGPATWGASAKGLLWNSGPGGGVGIYPSSYFIHADTRTYRSEWWG